MNAEVRRLRTFRSGEHLDIQAVLPCRSTNEKLVDSRCHFIIRHVGKTPQLLPGLRSQGIDLREGRAQRRDLYDE